MMRLDVTLTLRASWLEFPIPPDAVSVRAVAQIDCYPLDIPLNPIDQGFPIILTYGLILNAGVDEGNSPVYTMLRYEGLSQSFKQGRAIVVHRYLRYTLRASLPAPSYHGPPSNTTVFWADRPPIQQTATMARIGKLRATGNTHRSYIRIRRL